jgi:protein-S-isoprenylcysteine O-methyltransferase Ste14
VRQIDGPATIIAASFAAWILIEIWVLNRDRRQVAGKDADRGSLLTIMVAIAASVAGAFLASGVVHQAAIRSARPIVFCAGVALMWSGMGLRFWSITTLGHFFRSTVLVQDEHRLIIAGPYRLLRHPAYTGSILTMVGLGLALSNWLSLGVMLLGAAVAYLWRIRAEEAALGASFGAAYSDYRRGTWAVLPWVW